MDTQDTLAEWLFQRFITDEPFKSDTARKAWSELSHEDQQFWEHEARAVRRAVARGGFKDGSDSEPIPSAEGISQQSVEDLADEADCSRRLAGSMLAAMVRLGRPSRVSGE